MVQKTTGRVRKGGGYADAVEDVQFIKDGVRFVFSLSGGPVGVKTIAISVGEEVRTIEDVYEPYLIRIGFIKRTPRAGRRHRLRVSILMGTTGGQFFNCSDIRAAYYRQAG